MRSRIGPISAALTKVFGGNKPFTIARSLARDVIAESRLAGPPFDPFKFTRMLNLRIEYAPIEAEGVFTGLPGEDPKIVLPRPADSLPTRKRRRLNFTLAHEIGHYVIRRELYGFVPISIFATENTEEEALCSVFAAELLMPSNTIVRDFRSLGLLPEAFCTLGDRYDVSLQSLLCRATELWRGHLIAALWAKRDGQFTLTWITPKRQQKVVLTYSKRRRVYEAYRMDKMMLCDTGHSTIERAFDCAEPQYAKDYFIMDGKKTWWNTTSMRLPGSGLVLSIMRRDSKESRTRLPQVRMRPRQPFSEVKPPFQQSLPFAPRQLGVPGLLPPPPQAEMER
jgi:hypothetical protein